jgi:hypothetical protein
MELYFGFARELLDRGKAEVGEPYGADSLYDLLNQSHTLRWRRVMPDRGREEKWGTARWTSACLK